MGGAQRGQGDLVDVGLGAALIVWRNGMGGKMRGLH